MDTVSGFLDVFQNILLAFAAIAIFVAAFYINNTFSIVLLGQRSRRDRAPAINRRDTGPGDPVDHGRGDHHRADRARVGVAFGLVIAHVLQAILAAGGFDLPTNSLVLLGRTWLAAVVVGLGVTLAAAIVPARRVAAIPPIEGLREGFVVAHASSARRATIAGAVIACGALLVFFGLFVADGALPVLLSLGLGAIMVFLGVAQLSPVVAVPVHGAVGTVIARRSRLRVGSERQTAHATRIARRRPRRRS